MTDARTILRDYKPAWQALPCGTVLTWPQPIRCHCVRVERQAKAPQ